MSGYLSNLLTSTTDRYNSLRRNLLTSETDGDTEDDSHICRVLRAYYTEKSRSLPDWLPPDPKKATAVAQVQQTPPVGSSYGSLWNTSAPSVQQYPQQQQQTLPARSALNDLWDPPGAAQAQPTRATPVSLRGSGGLAGRQQQQQQQAPQQQQQTMLSAPTVVRPLPSQRAGSYQSQMSAMSARSGGTYGGSLQQQHQQQQQPQQSYQSQASSASGGGTAQERLKARLYGQGAGAGAGTAAGGYSNQSSRYGSSTGGGGGGGGRWG